MAYEQVERVLEQARTYHENVSEFYSRLSHQVDQQRAKLLLVWMSEHEQQLANALDDFVGGAQTNVMQTWFELSKDCMWLLESPAPAVQPSASVDELIQLGLQMDDRLIELYQELAGRSEPEAVRELFQSLLEQEQQEERQLARQALRCLDI